MAEDKLQEIIEPIWSENYVTIAMSSSQMYAPYLCVCLQSLKEHTSKSCNYDIVIFTSEINDETKEQIKNHIESENISVRYINPKKYFENIKLHISHSYFKEECYYRIVAPLIFKNYSKVIFTDIDLIFEHDIKDLYNTNLEEKPVAACIDLVWHAIINKQESLKNHYAMEILGLSDPYKYVNTGVIVIDIPKCLEMNFTNEVLNLVNNNKFETQEQCAMNAFLKEEFKYLDFSWNVSTRPAWIKEIIQFMNASTKENFDYAYNNAKIIHFLGSEKPWNHPSENLAYKWWQYARKTPYYEIILQRMLNNTNQNSENLTEQLHEAFNYKNNVLKYWKYKILSNIMYGKKKEYYSNKKHICKEKILIGKELRGEK